MDATFLKLINGIEWNQLTAAEAVELRTALREAVAKSEEWFAALSAGFEHSVPRKSVPTNARGLPYTGDTPLPDVMADAPKKPKVKGRKKTAVAHPPRRPRASRSPQAPGATPSEEEPEDHPPIMSLGRDGYVSTTGPDPGRTTALPVGHPRAAGGVGFDPSAMDPDFAVASRRKPEFN